MKFLLNIVFKLKKSDARLFGFLLVSLLFSAFSSAQTVKTSVNRDSIKIGEEVKFQIKVTSDSSAIVVFPESKTFGSLEVFNSNPPDTSFEKSTRKLNKTYSLTQFDAGSYTIPSLAVKIDDQDFATDSLKVQVDSVVVDTTEQNLYPIKKSIDYEAGRKFPIWVLWLVIALVAAALIVFFILRRKKKQREEKLPPYEAAIKELDELDHSESLKQGNYKDYYSRLTASVKRYLDEKVEEGVLEKTTDEVIARVRTLKNENKLYLKEHVIQSLEAVLRRADLTKFAGHSGDKITANEDRETIRNDIDAFDKSIAPPSEEELKRDLEYQREIKRQRRKRNLRFGILGGLGLLILVAAGFVLYNGWTESKEMVFGNEAEEMLQEDWITSTYGSPGISLTTPQVLVRDTTAVDSLSKSSLEKKATSIEHFGFGNANDDFQMKLTLMKKMKLKELSGELVTEHVNKMMDRLKGENITMTKDSLETFGGIKGLKITGKFTETKDDEKIRQNYTLLNFGQKGGIQQVLMLYKESEPAKKIAQRVVNAAQFKKEGQ
jgi:hypothetical protein